MTDPYGIPDNMFGYDLGEFPALVGRVVMVAAVVELKLEFLVMSLSGESQEAHAGKSAKASIDLCIKLLKSRRVDFPDEPAAFADHVVTLLNDVEVALHQRNAVVHSRWPEPGRGWRNLPKNQRVSGPAFGSPDWTKWIQIDEDHLQSLILLLCGLVDRLAQAIGMAGSLEMHSSERGPGRDSR
ncbi:MULTISPECIES: hypothetical protein [unclassified Arthrobacter]|uniref:hypothetical protein n=1 Tax=unclassified Arthrobacter TaxID=235627 RepID=UPI00254F059D|nr:hypothetical protein [Arthrobacter sp. efr-133-TYG-120]